MRLYVAAIALASLTAPVAAQAAGPIRVPPELTDPRTVERLSAMSEALSKALLDMPVGEVQAVAEGRPVTEADRRRTVRDLGRQSDPNFDRDVEQQVAAAGPMIRNAMKSFSAALPAITRALSEAADKIERATENMPRPDYPRR
ncbi:MAG: hypothetical protein M3448_08115 [Pseudomonadota bacterium]|nr:hypothetical protein [Sphingomonas sp.]MDQ3483350.1 hypothetical protein [Pseudomonadota bacterium]